jgi:hypothetical protein
MRSTARFMTSIGHGLTAIMPARSFRAPTAHPASSPVTPALPIIVLIDFEEQKRSRFGCQYSSY